MLKPAERKHKFVWLEKANLKQASLQQAHLKDLSLFIKTHTQTQHMKGVRGEKSKAHHILNAAIMTAMLAGRSLLYFLSHIAMILENTKETLSGRFSFWSWILTRQSGGTAALSTVMTIHSQKNDIENRVGPIPCITAAPDQRHVSPLLLLAGRKPHLLIKGYRDKLCWWFWGKTPVYVLQIGTLEKRELHLLCQWLSLFLLAPPHVKNDKHLWEGVTVVCYGRDSPDRFMSQAPSPESLQKWE